MVKVVGSALVLLGGVLARQLHLAERRRGLEALREVTAALRQMADAIRMARTPLPALLDALALGRGEAVGDFFRAAAQAARRGGDLRRTWETAAEELPLCPADRAALRELAGSLQGDEESVCRAINLVTGQLARSMEEQTRRRPEEEKRATALCLSGAALLVILLI